MIYIVHHFDATDSINTRTTTYHPGMAAAQAQYDMLVNTSEDFCRVELVGLEPNTLTEHVIQEDILNG